MATRTLSDISQAQEPQAQGHMHIYISGKSQVAMVSYTTKVVYSRDHKGVGMAHKIKSLEKQPQFSLTTIRQYWLGKTKPKQAFRSTRNAFNKLL